MKLQDYLHLYIGCEGIAETIAKFKTRLVISNHTNDMRDGVDLEDAIQHNFKPILRPLSDMTEEEFRQHFYDHWLEELDVATFEEQYRNVKCWAIQREALLPEHFHFLLSKHFDLFGLIEAGLAIDKTKEVAA
jgi:hypothetical protein